MAKTVFGLDAAPAAGESPDADPFADAPEIDPGALSDSADVIEYPENDPGDPLAPEPEGEAEVPPEAPETALDATETPVEAETEETPEAVEGTPYEGRYSTKYKTVEAYDEAHRNALDMAQRAAERAKVREQENQQLVQYLQAAAAKFEEIEKAQAVKPAATPDMELDPEVEALLQSRIDPTTRELAELKAQIVQQQQQSQMAATAAATQENIRNFRAQNGELDNETELGMVSVFEEFQFDPSDPNAYPVAHEAASSMEFRNVLRANPAFLDSSEGLDLARKLAGVHTVTQPSAPLQDDLAAARKRATVEGGGSGQGPVSEEKPYDEWDDVLNLARDNRKKSVFGV